MPGNSNVLAAIAAFASAVMLEHSEGRDAGRTDDASSTSSVSTHWAASDSKSNGNVAQADALRSPLASRP